MKYKEGKSVFVLLIFLFVISLVTAGSSFTDNSLNMTGNITADWLFSKLNASFIQNAPWLTSSTPAAKSSDS
jgi:hypothetical protein